MGEIEKDGKRDMGGRERKIEREIAVGERKIQGWEKERKIETETEMRKRDMGGKEKDRNRDRVREGHREKEREKDRKRQGGREKEIGVGERATETK